MSELDRTLRERLLNMDKPIAMRKESYERQVRAIVEGRLSMPVRLGLGLLAGIGVLLILDFLRLWRWALPPDEQMSRTVSSSVWMFGFLFALAWTSLTLYLAVRGRLGPRIRPSLVAGVGAGMVFVYMIVRTFGTEYALTRYNPQDWRIILGQQFAGAIFFLLVFAGLYLVLRVVYRVESSTREKLLEIEYRLADLAEKVGGKEPQ